jgi:hypothetical protein
MPQLAFPCVHCFQLLWYPFNVKDVERGTVDKPGSGQLGPVLHRGACFFTTSGVTKLVAQGAIVSLLYSTNPPSFTVLLFQQDVILRKKLLPPWELTTEVMG